jgi:hypothetical protein
VRDRIVQAIDALKPDLTAEPDYADRRWHVPLILSLVYLTGDGHESSQRAILCTRADERKPVSMK